MAKNLTKRQTGRPAIEVERLPVLGVVRDTFTGSCRDDFTGAAGVNVLREPKKDAGQAEEKPAAKKRRKREE